MMSGARSGSLKVVSFSGGSSRSGTETRPDWHPITEASSSPLASPFLDL